MIVTWEGKSSWSGAANTFPGRVICFYGDDFTAVLVNLIALVLISTLGVSGVHNSIYTDIPNYSKFFFSNLANAKRIQE